MAVKEKLINFIAKQKLMFAFGSDLLSIPSTIASQSLMILVASDKLKLLTGIQHTRNMIILAAVIYVSSVLIVGNVLDRAGFWKRVNKVWTDRIEAFNK